MPFLVAAIPAAVALGALWVRLDATGWLCQALAQAQGGEWFTEREQCPGCGRKVHVMCHSKLTGGHLCRRCVNGSPR